jgi:hypothetical protein
MSERNWDTEAPKILWLYNNGRDMFYTSFKATHERIGAAPAGVEHVTTVVI